MRKVSLLMVFAIFAMFAKTSDAWDFFGLSKSDPFFDIEEYFKGYDDQIDAVNDDIKHFEENKFQIDLMTPIQDLCNSFNKFVESFDFFGILDENDDKTKASNATIQNQVTNGKTNTSLIVKKPQISNSTISPSNNNNNTISKDNKH